VENKQLKHSEVKTLREVIWKEQDCVCLICLNQISLEKTVLDHQHKKKVKGSGLIRGVLCSNCNTFLGRIENNSPRHGINKDQLPDILRNMADYLEKDHLPYIHPTEKPKEPKLKKTSFNALQKVHEKELIYPKSGKLNKTLSALFAKYNLTPEFYK